MEGLETEARVATVVRLAQSLSVRGLERERVEEYGYDQVQAPDLVGLSEAVYAAHLALLVGSGEDAARPHLARDGLEQVLAVLGAYVLAELGQKLGRPLSLDLGQLIVQLHLALSLLVQGHASVVLLVELPLSRLQVQPGECERADVGQKGLDKGPLLVLRSGTNEERKINANVCILVNTKGTRPLAPAQLFKPSEACKNNTQAVCVRTYV